MKKINKVVIAGGTHGNELTGVYLAKKWMKDKEVLQRRTVDTDVIFVNPKATDIMKRYVDQDLNRSFLLKDLSNESLDNHEQKLARVLSKKIGPKGERNQNFDFVIDLHGTTSNMGVTLILDNQDPFTHALAGHLQKINPMTRIFVDADATEDAPFITSILPRGIVVEVGPIAQGVVDAHIFLETEKLVYQMLDFINEYNLGNYISNKKELDVYKKIKSIDYPRSDDGDITAMIHPALQGKDYSKLKNGEPIFLDFNGNEILYQDEEDVYPLFINEVSYYEKGIAMVLTEKMEIKI